MLKAEGLEYELHGDGEAVLLIHGSHVADAFLPLTRIASSAIAAEGSPAAIRIRARSASKNRRGTPWRS